MCYIKEILYWDGVLSCNHSVLKQEDVFPVDEVVLDVHDIHWQKQTRLFGKPSLYAFNKLKLSPTFSTDCQQQLTRTLDVVSDVARAANGVARILLHAELSHFQKQTKLEN